MSTHVAMPATTEAARGFHDILVAMDLGDASRAAAAQAARLAARFDGRLTLYHALEFPDHDAPHWAFSERPRVWTEYLRQAQDQLAECGRTLGVPWETVVERTGTAVPALLRRMVASVPDVTVMADRGHGALSHLLLGSMTEQVVKRSPCPLLCVRGDVPLDEACAGRIVLATDLSPAARHGLVAAEALARAFRGEVVVAHSAAPGVAWPWHSPAAREPWRSYADVERWLGPLPAGLSVRVLVDTASPARAVLRAAVSQQAGLVVVPRATGSGRLGSDDVMAVVRHAHCPVLVV